MDENIFIIRNGLVIKLFIGYHPKIRTLKV